MVFHDRTSHATAKNNILHPTPIRPKASRRWAGIFNLGDVDSYMRQSQYGRLRPIVEENVHGPAEGYGSGSGMGRTMEPSVIEEEAEAPVALSRCSITRANAIFRRRTGRQPIAQVELEDIPTPSPTEPPTSPQRKSVQLTDREVFAGVDAGTQTGGFISIMLPEIDTQPAIESPILPPTPEHSSNITTIPQQAIEAEILGLGHQSTVGGQDLEGISTLKKETEDMASRIKTLEAQLEALDEENAVLRDKLLPHAEKSDKNSGDFSNLVSGWIDTMHGRQKLFMDRLTLFEEKRVLERKQVELEERNRDLEDAISKQNQIFGTLLEDVKSHNPNPSPLTSPDPGAVPAFAKYWSELKLAKQLVSTISITPRVVLLCKLLQKQISPGNEERKKQGITKTFHALNSFDGPIQPAQAIAYSTRLDSYPERLIDSVSIKICSVCRLPKFISAPTASSHAVLLNEFHHRFGITSCCFNPVCTSCLPTAIVKSISTDWWHRLGQEYWIRCPVPNCAHPMPLRYNVDLTNMLRSMGSANVLAYVQQFDRANSLRAALEATNPMPTPEACRIAEALHSRLIKHKKMDPLFDMRTAYGLAVQMLPVDSPDGKRTLSVPIFTSLLKRAAIPRECMVCAEGIIDVDIEDEESWMAACNGFAGDWTWKIRAFPTKTLLTECSEHHDLDICRGCLARHLASRLDDLGRAGAEQLTCPTPSCGHVYTHSEIKSLAGPETFAKYDKFRLLSVLATMPNFRWCLREGCTSGKIYDTEADGSTMIWPQNRNPALNLSFQQTPIRNKIICEDCSFAMCFHHQTPWHEGLTCSAYDSQLRPEYAATTTWLATNTKKCPGVGCSVHVEKRGGCFHMTCRECRAEFCWECLADWKEIHRGGRYERSKHKEGCFFRDEDAPRPTQITGDTVGDAMGGMA
jgi:hypothetical protein